MATLNYSLVHAGMPFFRSLTLTNVGSESLDDLELQISLDPFARSDKVILDRLSPGAPHTLTELDFHYNLQQLLELRDPLSVRVDVQVCGESVAPENAPQVTVLPARAWHCAGHEAALASFVLKESDAVEEVITRARPLLRCLVRGATAWEDVQERDADPATTIAKTLYFCLQERYEIAYGREPHYYGKDWQAARFSAGVLDELEGTCIDLALLFAACLEDRSLCPLIVVVQSGIHPAGYEIQHALVGCWKEASLRWNRFRPSKPVEKDGQRIMSWLKDGDLILIDPVGFAHGKDADQLFSKSLKSARNYLERACARQPGHAFRYAVDIEVARLGKIQPLPVGAEIVFDRSSWLALARARQEAAQRASPAVGGRHLLLGLLSLDDGVLRQALTRLGPDLPDRVAEQARSNLGTVVKTGSRPPWKRTENLELVLNATKERARRDGRRLVADEDLVIALLENHKKVRGVLEEAGVTPAQCLDEVRGVLLARKDRPVVQFRPRRLSSSPS